MNLTCPSCGATFLVRPEQLGSAGRRLRCGECRHIWHQEPLVATQAEAQHSKSAVEPASEQAPEQAPEPAVEPASEQAPEQAPEPAVEPASEQAPEQAPELAVEPASAQASARTAAEPFAPLEAQEASVPEPTAEPEFVSAPGVAVYQPADPSRAPAAGATSAEAETQISRRSFSKSADPLMPQEEPPRSSLAAGWALFLVVVTGLAVGFYLGRAPLVALEPGFTRLYDLVGIEGETFILGLEVRIDKTEPRVVDDEQAVAVEGRVVNLSGGHRRVPPLRASVTNAKNEEIERWTFQAVGGRLPPGGSTGFITVAKNPPPGGNLTIEFAIAD